MNAPRESTGPAAPAAAKLLLRLEAWLLLITVGVMPLAYAPGILEDFFNMPKVALLFVVVALAAALRASAALLGARAGGFRLLAVPASAMSVAFVASWIGSDYRTWSVLGLYGRYGGLLPYLAIIAFAVLVADAFAGRAERILYALVAGGTGVGLYGLIQMLFLGAKVGAESQTAYITSTLGHSNFAGGYLAIMLPLSIGLWVQPGRLARWGMGATILIGSGLLFTVSQGAWLAAIGGGALLTGLLTAGRRSWAPRLGAVVALATAAASAGAIVVSMAIPHAYARLPDYLATAVSRGFLWRAAFASAAQSPLLGGGPNTYAIEGPLHLPVEGALLTNFVKGDEPHSVPLAMLANLGLVGFAAFLFLFAWAVTRWRTKEPAPIMRTAAFAAIVTYAIQALVSIDEPALRFSLWVLLAATACFTVAEPASPRAGRRGWWRVALAPVAIATGLVAAAAAALTLPIADRHVHQGMASFNGGAVAEGRVRFLRALDLREDNEYRLRYGLALGNAALRGIGGAGSIEEMKDAFSYLDSFPDAHALALYAKLLNRWSFVRPEANLEALEVYRKATELEPYNPLLALDVADALLQEGRPGEAEQHLQPFERLLTERYPEYASLYSDVWAALAIARAKLGLRDEAAATLRKATATGSCHYGIAAELLKPPAEQGRPSALAFLCPRAFLRLLPPS